MKEVIVRSATAPILPVRVTVGGVPATIRYGGSAPGQVAGLMQVNVQIPGSVDPGGYVPVVLQVGDRTSSPAVWIAVSAPRGSTEPPPSRQMENE